MHVINLNLYLIGYFVCKNLFPSKKISYLMLLLRMRALHDGLLNCFLTQKSPLKAIKWLQLLISLKFSFRELILKLNEFFSYSI